MVGAQLIIKKQTVKKKEIRAINKKLEDVLITFANSL